MPTTRKTSMSNSRRGFMGVAVSEHLEAGLGGALLVIGGLGRRGIVVTVGVSVGCGVLPEEFRDRRPSNRRADCD
jgi:hypothetical protein